MNGRLSRELMGGRERGRLGLCDLEVLVTKLVLVLALALALGCQSTFGVCLPMIRS